MKTHSYTILRSIDLKGLMGTLEDLTFPLQVVVTENSRPAKLTQHGLYRLWVRQIVREITNDGDVWTEEQMHAHLKEEYGIETLIDIDQEELSAYMSWLKSYAYQHLNIPLHSVFEK